MQRKLDGLGIDEDFDAMRSGLHVAAAEKERVELIPFLLEGVGGRPRYNQADGIHPNVEGHALIAEALWPILRPHLISAVSRTK